MKYLSHLGFFCFKTQTELINHINSYLKLNDDKFYSYECGNIHRDGDDYCYILKRFTFKKPNEIILLSKDTL